MLRYLSSLSRWCAARGRPKSPFIPGIVPKSGEPLLDQAPGGIFHNDQFEEILKKQGIETLVLMGINTGRVVVTTVCFAADMDYKLIVLSDCCADSDEEVHRFLIEKLLPRWATVVTSQPIP